MATTQNNSPATDLKFSRYYQDDLNRIWKEADRPDVYSREQQFSYFWDARDVVDQKK